MFEAVNVVLSGVAKEDDDFAVIVIAAVQKRIALLPLPDISRKV